MESAGGGVAGVRGDHSMVESVPESEEQEDLDASPVDREFKTFQKGILSYLLKRDRAFEEEQ